MFGFTKRLIKEREGEPQEEETEVVCEVIDGLLYDTSKAEKIIKVFRGAFSVDLYKTKNQRFFTAGKNTGIKPRTEDEVKRILSRYPDKYQEVFGKVRDA